MTKKLIIAIKNYFKKKSPSKDLISQSMAKYINQQQNYKHAPHLRNQLRKKISINKLSQEYLYATRIYPELWQSLFGSNSISDFRYAKLVRYSKLVRSLIPTRRHRKKIIAASLAISLIIFLIAPFLPSYFQYFGSQQVQAAWYDDSWSYREKITIGNTGSADSNKKVKFDIDTSTIITAGKSQSDCDDYRFTDVNGKLLRYYLDSAGGACSTSSTDFYVLVETINSGNTDLYMYYSNPAAIAGTQTSQFSESTFAPTSGPTVGSEEKATSPQVYLKFDEGYGTNTQDSTSNNNDGSISGAAWKTSEACLTGNCLYYDGTDDVVTVTNADSIDLDRHLAAAFTISAWIRPNGAGEGTGGQIFYKGTNTWLRVDTLSSGKLDIQASLDLTTPATLNVSAVVNDNAWNHVALSYTDDGDDEITIWVNGRSVGSSTDGVGSPSSDSNNILIGGTTTNNFKGFIDEFKIYKQERSAAQIIANAQKAPLPEGAASSFGPDTSFLSQGLVGYWKMDDAGVDAEGETSTDSSGNGNTGTLYGDNGVGDNGTGMDCTTGGKYGTGCDFDGTDDYVDTTLTPPSGNLTLSAWVYADSIANDSIVSNTNNGPCTNNESRYFLSMTRFVVKTSGGCADESTLNYTQSAGQWNLVTATYNFDTSEQLVYVNGELSANLVTTQLTNVVQGYALNIGTNRDADATFMDGKIDEVRVYNRALSPAEVAKLYNWAPGQIGYWKMDEGSGTTVSDSSGNGNVSSAFTGNTTWTTGKFGSALTFDGTDDVARIVESSSTDLGATTDSYTVSGWINTTTNYSANASIFSKNDATGAYPFDLYLNSSEYACFQISDGTNSPSTCGSTALNDGNWHYISGKRDVGADTIYIFVDGVQINSTTDTATATTANNDDLSIGNAGASYTGADFNGQIDDVRIYNYVRTPGQIIEDMNAGHPAPGSPVGSAILHWNMDQGADNTCSGGTNDVCNSGSGGTSQDAANSGAAWNNSGKFGKAIYINNAGDTINAGDVSFVDGLTSMTVSFWLNPDSLTASRFTIGKWPSGNNSNSFRIGIPSTSSDELRINIASSTTDTANYFTTTNLDLVNSTWQQVTVVYDGTLAAADRIKVYKNATQVSGSVTGTVPTSMTTGTTSSLILGDLTAQTAGLLAKYDEVKIYTSALTSDQIKLLYNQSSSSVWGTLSTNASGTADNSSERSYCPPGDTTATCSPVGEWKMDENTETSVNDSTGNITTSISLSGSPVWIPGKSGSALSFDGTDDYGDGPTDSDLNLLGDMTAEFWINIKSADDQDNIFSYRGTGGGEDATNYIFRVRTSSGYDIEYEHEYNDARNSETNAFDTNLSLNTWYHIAAVRNNTAKTVKLFVNGIQSGSTFSYTNVPWRGEASNLRLGNSSSGGSRAYSGNIDLLRLFNYARTPAQIAWDYNRGAPIGWWKFDECQGVTAYDSGSNTYTGTITPGDTTGDNDTVGTCSSGTTTEMWNDGTNGKRNSSLGFDGTNDYVSMSDNANLRFDAATADFSLFAWIKRAASGANHTVVAKEEADNDGWRLLLTSGNTVQCSVAAVDVTSSSTITDTNWHQVGCTIDRDGNGQIYIDGRADGTATAISSTTMATTSTVRIGTNSISTPTNYFSGQIDDVKIFNYALTAQQIKTVYNDGVINFAPITGSP